MSTRKKRVVHWAVISSSSILDRGVWPGRYIPIVAVLGDELRLNGERQYAGLVRWARDPQRMYNYWRSAITESIALAPKPPVVGAEGQFEDHEGEWQNANTQPYNYLQYKPITIDGNLVGPPKANDYHAPIQEMVVALSQSDNDLKAVNNLYDASLGKQGPEQSGRAILARQKQGDIGNSDYATNFARAKAHAGRILIDAIPKVYDAARVIRILSADQTPRLVAINHPFQPGQGQRPPRMLEPGELFQEGLHKLYDLTLGTYSVSVNVGPSFVTRRQEAVASMLELVKADPEVIKVIGDLLVSNMDWPGAREIAERLKKLLPPQLQENQGGYDLPPQVQAEIAQSRQMIDLLTKQLNEATEIIKTKQLELASKEYITGLQEQTKLAIAEAKISAENAQFQIQAEYERLTTLLELSHDRIMAENQVAADAAKLGAQHTQERGMAAIAAAQPPAQPGM